MNTDKIYAEHIANQYAPKEESKIKALKRLDAKAKNPANIFAYTFGVVSALILGIGMCLSMGVLGDGNALMMGLGSGIGCIGIAGAGVNYPIYTRILKKSKDKYASEIIALANEIAGEDEE